MKDEGRYEIIDGCDIVCAVASNEADAVFALASKKASGHPMYAGAYVFDTKTKKVIRR